jgi:hypothetical protein
MTAVGAVGDTPMIAVGADASAYAIDPTVEGDTPVRVTGEAAEVAPLSGLIAARFSPHSTQKRAPVTTGAPHCGQNLTVSSGLRRAGDPAPPT